MVDCPEKLHTGADLLVSLSIYMRPAAFKRYEIKKDRDTGKEFWWNEGQETQEEEILRDRKSSLRQLFDKLDLKPRAGNDLTVDKENVPPASAKGKERQSNGSPSNEEEEEDVLSQNELDVIYRK